MSQLIVRRVEADIVRKLKLRAARRGRSAEAEHREILREALERLAQDFAVLGLGRASAPCGAELEFPHDVGLDAADDELRHDSLHLCYQ